MSRPDGFVRYALRRWLDPQQDIHVKFSGYVSYRGMERSIRLRAEWISMWPFENDVHWLNKHLKLMHVLHSHSEFQPDQFQSASLTMEKVPGQSVGRAA